MSDFDFGSENMIFHLGGTQYKESLGLTLNYTVFE